MARPYPKTEITQAPPAECDMSDLLDKISAEYNDEMQKPEDSFTCNEFGKKNDMTRGKAQSVIGKLFNSGKLKRKKIGSQYYYYAGE